MPTRSTLAMFLCLGLLPSAAQPQERQDLARKAKQILQTHCYRCHGENGAVEGGMNYLLDRHQFVSRGKVLPGQPAKSRLIKRIQTEEMPPEEEKQRRAEELKILKDWVAAGAPDFNPPLDKREFITQLAIQKAIQKDLAELGQVEQRFTRYLTISHLYNSGLSTDELTTFRQGISKLINSLSWGKRIVAPAAIDPAQTIFRIDLRDYKWSERTWAMLESHYPYGLLLETELERSCQKSTGARFVALRGDWFVAAAALPPLYHDLLGLPHTDRALEKNLMVNVLDNQRDGQTMRAAFNGSGVSRNNRLIERHQSLFGAFWKSYDFASNTDRQNLFAVPLGPGLRTNSFEHDGGEIIFSLPNGLQGYMLVDAKGNRLDKGPTEIVSDPRRPDRTVVNGLSCMSCHSRGIIHKEDQVRPHVEKNRKAFLKDELEAILSLYAPREKLTKAMEEDAERFRRAVEKSGGGRIGATEPIVALVLRFEAEMDLTLAAAELGMTAADLQKHFDKSVTLGRLLGPLAVQGGTVQREVFTEAFASLVRDLELGKAEPRERRESITWSGTIRPPQWKPPPWAPTIPRVPTNPTNPTNPVEPKVTRLFMPAPSARGEDPWYFHLSAHQSGQLHAVAISPKNKWLSAFESKIGIVSIYSQTDRDIWFNMPGHKGNILSLDFSSDGGQLVSGSIDQTAKIWDAAAGRERLTLGGHAGFVSAVKFSPDGQWVATGSERVRLWSTADGREKFVFDKTPSWVECLAFSPNGWTIASASKSLQLWDAVAGKLQATLVDEPVHAVVYSPDGKLLAYGGDDGAITLWDVAAKKTKLVLKGHRQPVNSLAFNVSGKLLISGSGKHAAGQEEGEFKAWDVETGKELLSQTGHKRGISCVAISPDGRHAISAGLDGHLRYRELMSLGKAPLDPFEGHFNWIHAVAVSKDGRLAVTAGDDRTVRVWDAATGTQLHRMEGHTDHIHDVAVAPDSKHAYSASPDKTLREWDLATGKETRLWKFPTFVQWVTLSADGKMIAVRLGGDVVRLFDPVSGEKIQEIKGLDRAVALSPDGRRLAGAAIQKPVRVWDTATGQEIAVLGTGRVPIEAAAFSPDGKRLLIGSHDNSVCLWDIESGKEITRYKGCTKPVRRVAFCDQGRKVLASSGDHVYPIVDGKQNFAGCSVYLWDTASAQELLRWDTDPVIVRQMAASDQGRFAVFVTRGVLKKVPLP